MYNYITSKGPGRAEQEKAVEPSIQELWWHLPNPEDRGLSLSTYFFCLHFHTNTSYFLLMET